MTDSEIKLGDLGPCEEWTGSRDERKKMEQASRVALADKLGRPIGAGLWALHRCDNPPCVAKAHLYEGTPADNTRDRDERGRRRPPKGELNGRAKLTPDDVVKIKERREAGDTLASIGSSFGVGTSQVRRITKGEQWTTL